MATDTLPENDCGVSLSFPGYFTLTAKQPCSLVVGQASHQVPGKGAILRAFADAVSGHAAVTASAAVGLPPCGRGE